MATIFCCEEMGWTLWIGSDNAGGLSGCHIWTIIMELGEWGALVKFFTDRRTAGSETGNFGITWLILTWLISWLTWVIITMIQADLDFISLFLLKWKKIDNSQLATHSPNLGPANTLPKMLKHLKVNLSMFRSFYFLSFQRCFLLFCLLMSETESWVLSKCQKPGGNFLWCIDNPTKNITRPK